MTIWLDQNSKVLVQGMTGSEGRKHTQRMISSGTRVVGGVTPGKGGQTVTFIQLVSASAAPTFCAEISASP